MTSQRSPMRWIPSLYFLQGLQYFVVTLIPLTMFKSMGVANEVITRWLAVLGLAWALKPLWSPFLEMVRSKKLIVVAMQYLCAAALGLMAVALQMPHWFPAAIGVLFIIAYASATHDVACDGLYMASFDAERQAGYAGWQGAFFNGARFMIRWCLFWLVGQLERSIGIFNAWSVGFLLLAVLELVMASHNARELPAALNAARSDLSLASVRQTLWEVIVDFFRKPGIWIAILFIVLFRFGEGQVQAVGQLFLMEGRAKGGLGLTLDQVSKTYGLVGTACFLAGSILGGYFTSWLGLKRAMPILIIAMAVPNVTFYYLSMVRPEDLLRIDVAVGFEMLGYGFGFVGMILYIMQAVAPGRFQMAHYALGSGVMQLGMVFSTAISGDMQRALGYEHFFAWTIVCGLPVLLLMFFVRMPGKSAASAAAAAA